MLKELTELKTSKALKVGAVALGMVAFAVALTTAVHAATPLPEGETVVQEAINGCGGGYVYTAKMAKFNQAQTEWLGTILSYLNNGELNHPGIDIEESTNGVASEESVLAMLSQAEARSWAGDALTQALTKVVEGRQALHAKGRQFFEASGYRSQPAFQQYQSARQAAFEALKAKGVTQIDRGIRCN